jgi:hypothetical protein
MFTFSNENLVQRFMLSILVNSILIRFCCEHRGRMHTSAPLLESLGAILGTR